MPLFLTAGFRPFFLLAALWAAIAVPLWLAAYAHGYALPGSLPAMLWHGHEMVFGYGLATVAGFLLTAIPNWTGRLPVRGVPLAVLAALWLAGRVALLASSVIGGVAAAAFDLAFSLALIAVVARELIAGRNYRNLPMLAALSLLFFANLLMHLHATGVAFTANLGLRIGIATLLALIALVGGRIIPSFTRNWLVKNRREVAPPAQIGRFDLVCLVLTLAGLIVLVVSHHSQLGAAAEMVAGAAALARLSRWRGLATIREPLLVVLHAGYAWLGLGLLFLGLNDLFAWIPPSGAAHALTVGAIGTMTLAVMTRASLGHSGRPLVAGPGTVAIYILVTLAAVLRVAAPFAGIHMILLVSVSGAAWAAAFLLFALVYGPLLLGRKP